MRFIKRVQSLYKVIAAGVPLPDYPPANIASWIKQCLAKGREDLANKIQMGWEATYAKNHLNWKGSWGAASAHGLNSIKRHIFGGKEFIDWFNESEKLNLDEAKVAKDSSVLHAINPKTRQPVPAIAVPKPGETEDHWKVEEAKTKQMLVDFSAAFKSTEDFVAFLKKDIAETEAKLAAYSPGGAKHLTKSGKPHAFVEKLPKWQAYLSALKKQLEDTTSALNEVKTAAAEYPNAKVATVAFEKDVQESLAEVLGFILEIKNLEKQKQLLQKFNESLKKIEQGVKVESSVVQAASIFDFISSLWEMVKAFFVKLGGAVSGLKHGAERLSALTHMVG